MLTENRSLLPILHLRIRSQQRPKVVILDLNTTQPTYATAPVLLNRWIPTYLILILRHKQPPLFLPRLILHLILIQWYRRVKIWKHFHQVIVDLLIHTGQSQFASLAPFEDRPVGLGVVYGCTAGRDTRETFSRRRAGRMISRREQPLTFDSKLLFDLGIFVLNSLTKTR